MKLENDQLSNVQQLVLDIIKVERGHRIPGTERRENVVEHSFSVAVLCWKIYEAVRPPLDMSKIFKYALAHDFLERGYKIDVNTYASSKEKEDKKEREISEMKKMREEFSDFDDLIVTLNMYDQCTDEEALFVRSIDKMQGIILGGIDHWRPYASHEITYDQFCAKGEEFLGACSPYVKEVFVGVLEKSRATYYDQPKV